MTKWFYKKGYGLINLDRYDRITKCEETNIISCIKDMALPNREDRLKIDDWHFSTKEEMRQVYNQIKKILMENKGR